MRYEVTIPVTMTINAVDEQDATELAGMWLGLVDPRITNVGEFEVKELWQEEAEAMLQDGRSYQEAAEAVGKSRSTLQRHLPGYGRKTGQWRERGLEMLEEGQSYREVARTLGIDSRTVQRAFPGYGFTDEETQMVRQANALLKKVGA